MTPDENAIQVSDDLGDERSTEARGALSPTTRTATDPAHMGMTHINKKGAKKGHPFIAIDPNIIPANGEISWNPKIPFKTLPNSTTS